MGQKKVKISQFPQFYSKNDPEKPPHLVWGFFMFQCFVFFLIFAFSCLSFSSFPLLLDFLKPKTGPSIEVIGYFLSRNICCITCQEKVCPRSHITSHPDLKQDRNDSGVSNCIESQEQFCQELILTIHHPHIDNYERINENPGIQHFLSVGL